MKIDEIISTPKKWTQKDSLFAFFVAESITLTFDIHVPFEPVLKEGMIISQCKSVM